MITLSKRKIFLFCAGFTFALGMAVAFGTAFLMSAPGIKDMSTIPQLVSYQGTLTDKNGVPVNGTFEMFFAVYDTESGGLPLGEKVCIPDVELKEGCFIVLLPIAQLVQSGEPKYLEISIDGQTLVPRQQIASVFYALKAGDALTLQGKIPDDFAPISHKHSGDDITSAVAQAVNADTVDGKHATEFAASSHTHSGTDITSAVANATNASNADTVDGFHATSTPTPNKLLAMDGSGKLPTGALKVFVRDWFKVSINNSYTETHNLGTTALIICVYFATDDSGSNMLRIPTVTHTESSSYTGGCVVTDISTTQFTIKTGGCDVAGLTAYPNDDSSVWGGAKIFPTRQASGYYKIVAIALE